MTERTMSDSEHAARTYAMGTVCMTGQDGRLRCREAAFLARERYATELADVSSSLRFRVDVYCAGGWQHLGSFAGETDAYEYGEGRSLSGARVWNGDDCIAVTYGRRSWHAPRHNRNCNGKPCECGAVPPIGSMARGEREREATKMTERSYPEAPIHWVDVVEPDRRLPALVFDSPEDYRNAVALLTHSERLEKALRAWESAFAGRTAQQWLRDVFGDPAADAQRLTADALSEVPRR